MKKERGRLMLLGSPEYLAEVARRTNSDLEYLQLAKGQNETYTLALEAEPTHQINARIVIGYRIEDGRITETWQGERPTSFTLSGPYSVWVSILRGDLDPIPAFMKQKLHVKGNLIKLVSGANFINRWVAILRTIPTEFAGDYQ
jgi:putative sterol carrier protein